MPFLGPNCYGYINYLDHIHMWPDQHGGKEVEKGVAIIAQSSNIAINLTMNTRSTPIAYILKKKEFFLILSTVQKLVISNLKRINNFVNKKFLKKLVEILLKIKKYILTR